MKKNVIKMYGDGIPVTAIAKRMSISCAIVKKIIKKII
mgnify:CR=1 FL=1